MTAENANRLLIAAILILWAALCSALLAGPQAETVHALTALEQLPDLAPEIARTADNPDNLAAEVLFESGYKEDGWSQTRFTVIRRIKIYTDQGLSHASFYVTTKPREYIEEVRARIIAADGRAGDYFNPDPADRLVSYADPWGPEMQTIFQLPAAAGDIIEYKYVVNTTLGQGLRFNSWFMQRLVPVRESRYTLDAPRDFMPYEADVENIDLTLFPEVEETEERRRTTYTFVRIPPLDLEPQMPPLRYVQGRLMVDYQWEGGASSKPVGFWLQFGRNQAMRVNKFLEEYRGLPEVIDEIITGDMDTRARISAILSWVRGNIANLEHLPASDLSPTELEDWQPGQTAEKVLRNREGGPLEVSMLTVGLLREAGLYAYLGLGVDRRQGALRHTLLDSRQFDRTFVVVRLPDNSAIYLDPTVPSLGAGRLPWFLQGSLSLLCTRHRSVFARLPVDYAQANEISLTLQLEDIDQEHLAATMHFELTGQHSMQIHADALRHGEQSVAPLVLHKLEGVLGYVTIESLALERSSITTATIAGSAEVSIAKDHIVKAGALDFSSLAQVENVGISSTDRQQPLYFDYPWQTSITVSISNAPFKSIQLPREQILLTEVGEFHSRWWRVENRIFWKKRLVQERVFFQPNELVIYQSFIEKVEGLNEVQRAAFER